MAFRLTEWPQLIRFEPEEAKTKILAAFREKMGSAVAAAKLLEITPRQLNRYMAALELTNEIDALRRSLGHAWQSTSSVWGTEAAEPLRRKLQAKGQRKRKPPSTE